MKSASKPNRSNKSRFSSSLSIGRSSTFLPARRKTARLAEVHGERQMVCDDDLGLAELPDSFDQDLTACRIEIIRWFIQGEDLGIHGQHRCQGHPLLLSLAQVMG